MENQEVNKTSDEIINELFSSLNVPLSPKLVEVEENISKNEQVSAHTEDSDNSEDDESDSKSSESEGEAKATHGEFQEGERTEKTEKLKSQKKKKDKRKKKKKHRKKEDGGRHKHKKKKKKDNFEIAEEAQLAADVFQDVKGKNQAFIRRIMIQKDITHDTEDGKENGKRKSRSKSPKLSYTHSEVDGADSREKLGQPQSDLKLSPHEVRGSPQEEFPESPSHLQISESCKDKGYVPASMYEESASRSEAKSCQTFDRSPGSEGVSNLTQTSPTVTDGHKRKQSPLYCSPSSSPVKKLKSSNSVSPSKSSSPKPVSRQRSPVCTERSGSRSTKDSKSDSCRRTRSRSPAVKRSKSQSKRSGSKSRRSRSKSRKSRSRSRKRSESKKRSGSRKRSTSRSRKKSESKLKRRSRSRSKKRSRSRSRRRSRSWRKSRSRSRRRARSRSKKRSRSRSRKGSKSKRRSRSKSKHRSRSKSRRRSRSKSRKRSGSKSRRKSVSVSKRSRSEDRSRSRSRKLSGSKGRSKSKVRSRSRGKSRSQSHKRSRSRSSHRSSPAKERFDMFAVMRERANRLAELKSQGIPDGSLGSLLLSAAASVQVGGPTGAPQSVPTSDPGSIPLPQKDSLLGDSPARDETVEESCAGVEEDKTEDVVEELVVSSSQEADSSKSKEGSKSKQDEGNEKGKIKTTITIKSLKDSLVFQQAQEEAERKAKEIVDEPAGKEGNSRAPENKRKHQQERAEKQHQSATKPSKGMPLEKKENDTDGKDREEGEEQVQKTTEAKGEKCDDEEEEEEKQRERRHMKETNDDEKDDVRRSKTEQQGRETEESLHTEKPGETDVETKASSRKVAATEAEDGEEGAENKCSGKAGEKEERKANELSSKVEENKKNEENELTTKLEDEDNENKHSSKADGQKEEEEEEESSVDNLSSKREEEKRENKQPSVAEEKAEGKSSKHSKRSEEKSKRNKLSSKAEEKEERKKSKHLSKNEDKEDSRGSKDESGKNGHPQPEQDSSDKVEEGEIVSDKEEVVTKPSSKTHSKKSKKDKSNAKEKKRSHKEKSKNKEEKKKGHDKKKEQERARSRSKGKTRSRQHASSGSKEHSHSRRYRKPSRSRSRSRSRDHASRQHRRSHSRSRSKSRSKRRRESTSDLRDKVTRKRLLEIARRNAVYLMQNGCLPPSVEKEQLVKIKAGGKSVDELTDFCKQLVASGNYSDVDVSEPSMSSEEENNSEKPFSSARHPFSVRDSKPILMNIRNAPMLPTKTNAERLAGQAKLREQFPVSSGSQHRTKESEWVPVAPKEKKEEDKVFTKPEAPSVDISQIVSTRLSAMRKLQDNPNDSEAIKALNNVQKEMQNWALSKQEPGQFTGTTGVKVLSQEELSAGHQAWARKEQFKEAAPVRPQFGLKMLQKMGWSPGEGLGKNKEGTTEPLLLDVKMDKKGFHAQEEVTPKKQPIPLVKDLSGKHPVSALVELCSKRKWSPPDFEMVFDCGPDHNKNFLMKVMVNGQEFKPSVAASTKKMAKANAAAAYLQSLGLYPKDPRYPL